VFICSHAADNSIMGGKQKIRPCVLVVYVLSSNERAIKRQVRLKSEKVLFFWFIHSFPTFNLIKNPWLEINKFEV